MTSDPEACVAVSREAVLVAEKQRDLIGKGHAIMHIGLGYFHKGELSEALKHYLKAESLFEQEQHLIGLRSVLNNIGIIYDSWQQKDKALEYYQKTLDMEAILPAPQVRCNAFKNIGNVYEWAREYDKAREFYQNALEIAKASGFDNGIALCCSGLGKLNTKTGNTEEGIALILQAREVNTRTGNISGIIDDLDNLASAMIDTGDFTAAKEYLDEALEKAVQLKLKRNLAWIYLRYAQLARHTREPELEIDYLNKALQISEPNLYRNISYKAYNQLALAREKQGEHRLALKALWAYLKLHDYIIDENKLQNINRLKIQMEVEEREREMQMIRLRESELEKKNSLILKQKAKLERAEKKLRELNRTLEQRVSDEILRRRQQEQMLIQKSKLESLGRMAAGIAHEINQPLGMINLSVQNLFHRISVGKIDQAYIMDKSESIGNNIERINRIIDHIRLFSRDQQGEALEPVDVCQTIMSAVSLVKLQFQNQNIRMDIELDAESWIIAGNKYRLEQVILNLLSNAKDALDEKYDAFDDSRMIRIRCKRKGSRIQIEIEDNGIGIGSDVLPQIFEPFYTTKSEARGTGLGLSICYGIIQEMKGNITCHSTAGKGTLMKIEFETLKTKGIS
jgi:two-component system, NtrC family, sensor kinase